MSNFALIPSGRVEIDVFEKLAKIAKNLELNVIKRALVKVNKGRGVQNLYFLGIIAL